MTKVHNQVSVVVPHHRFKQLKQVFDLWSDALDQLSGHDVSQLAAGVDPMSGIRIVGEKWWA